MMANLALNELITYKYHSKHSKWFPRSQLEDVLTTSGIQTFKKILLLWCIRVGCGRVIVLR